MRDSRHRVDRPPAAGLVRPDVRRAGTPRPGRIRISRLTITPRWACGGWPSSTWPAASSPCTTRTGPWSPCSTARSTTSAELREDLRRRGHRLTTNGDSECLVHLYEEYGDDLVHRLRGMFAFAIWDVRGAPAAAGPRPGGQEAAVLARRRDVTGLRIRTQGAGRGPGCRPADRPGRPAPLPHLPVRAGAVVDLPGRPEAAAGTPAQLAGRGDRGQPVLAARLHPARGHVDPGGRRAAARACSSTPRGCGWSANVRWARSCPVASTPPPWSPRWPGRLQAR